MWWETVGCARPSGRARFVLHRQRPHLQLVAAPPEREGEAQRLDEVADADRLAVAGREQVDDPNPSRVTERLEQLGGRFRLVVGQNLRG